MSFENQMTDLLVKSLSLKLEKESDDNDLKDVCKRLLSLLKNQQKKMDDMEKAVQEMVRDLIEKSQ